MDNFDKKVLFLDVDGTIVDSSNMRIPDSTIEILKELSLRDDIDVFISTGRTYHGLFEINEIKPFVDGYNLANGTQIIYNNQTLFIDPIEKDILKRFIKELEERNTSYVLLSPQKIFKKYYDEELRKIFDNVVKGEYVNITNSNELELDDIIEAWVLAHSEDIDRLIVEFPDLTFYKWGYDGCDTVKKDSSKGLGINRIVELLGYDINKTYAFGDADNDIPMFEVAKYSIAMGQSQQKIKDAATFVTAPVGEDGLKIAIEKYVLNKE